ncbi:MAG: sugar transferase [Ardenticatenaceae bacterium]|nr:sugar transferase [Ardenticatenaceae bacterium]
MEHKILDHKAAKMLEIYAEERFKDGRSAQRLRLQLVLWVLRMKVLGSLKRLLDFSVAAVMLLLLSPLMSITALLVKWTSPGPIFFGQTRVGKYGTHFTCYKFRSMYTDAEERKAELMKFNEADGPVFKMKNDPRITSVGRIIRKLSIDELPQLWNVLRGDMSLVGPPPPLPKEVAEYNFDQLRRLHTIPGITGLQQVSGRSNMDFTRWVELDLQYIAQQSFWNDIKILFKTIPAVLFSRGAY